MSWQRVLARRGMLRDTGTVMGLYLSYIYICICMYVVCMYVVCMYCTLYVQLSEL